MANFQNFQEETKFYVPCSNKVWFDTDHVSCQWSHQNSSFTETHQEYYQSMKIQTTRHVINVMTILQLLLTLSARNTVVEN